MDSHKQLMIIVKGEDKTYSVASFRFDGNQYYIQYYNASKVYTYNSYNVQILNLRGKIDPKSVIVFANDAQITGIEEILDFGDFYRLSCKEKKYLSFRKDELCFLRKNLFDYFRETAETVGLVTDNGTNILSRQYQKITSVRADTVLASYLEPNRKPGKIKTASALIYPFKFNQSQKKAIENAFSSQVSIIQGPPGTGKTQTILNIIANAVLNHKTVAVVSNNNSSTSNVADKLEKKGFSFLTASLGNLNNKTNFLKEQDGKYPKMDEWELKPVQRKKLAESVKLLSEELNEMLNKKRV